MLSRKEGPGLQFDEASFNFFNLLDNLKGYWIHP